MTQTKRKMPKTISFYATPDEMYQVELIKRFHHRKTTTDMLRQLIAEEAEKILAIRATSVANSSQVVSK